MAVSFRVASHESIRETFAGSEIAASRFFALAEKIVPVMFRHSNKEADS
ncbi:hypothetical protein HY26_11690 [Hyphomonas sp. GM-8P]|nr:hypothetical protein HY26_11690 [Hyphomonas sp. GM-8P]